MKIILLTFIILSSAAIGFYKARNLQKREQMFSEIILIINDIKTYIRFRNIPLKEIFSDIAVTNDSEFIKSLNENLQKKSDFHECWTRSVEELYMLTESDKNILLNLGNKLGTSDSEGQLSVLHISENFIRDLMVKAREENIKKSKMYKSVGVLLGIGIAIILI